MIRTAVLLTVYNRREVTLQGLRSLHKAIEMLGGGYIFDVYMTDDGCTDGTSEAVANEFPDINIIKGNGNLYWSGGMRKAWQAAIDSGVEYDYFLWFNDDAQIFKDAFLTIFHDEIVCGGNVILTGAFCDMAGKPSYGGKTKSRVVIAPDGNVQPVELMNGTFVLIPKEIYAEIGINSELFRHGFGDYDYGLRAKRKGLGVFLTHKYVGSTERHDEEIPAYFSIERSLSERWRIMHDPRNSPKLGLCFNLKYMGVKKAVVGWVRSYFYMLCPYMFYKKHHLPLN